ncbi:MAG: RpiB/LacA/LacB family sugar-phosphate isomerase [Gemmataceae bacterium]
MKLEGRNPVPEVSARWAFGQDRPHDYVAAAVKSLRREGLHVREVPLGSPPCVAARRVAEEIGEGVLAGGVLFCQVPCIVACVANKVPGVRAVMVSTVGQAALATLELAANLLVVEMPGRTFYEVKQFLRIIHDAKPELVPVLANTLMELDGRAHR